MPNMSLPRLLFVSTLSLAVLLPPLRHAVNCATALQLLGLVLDFLGVHSSYCSAKEMFQSARCRESSNSVCQEVHNSRSLRNSLPDGVLGIASMNSISASAL